MIVLNNPRGALRLLGVVLLCLSSLALRPVHSADLAIVIDDVGYSWMRGHRAIHLPGQITIAVLPFAPHTGTLVPDAIRVGKDVIIHQPMEPQPSPRVREETGTLRLDMQAEEFDAVLARALAAVPQRSGLSNHTGSLLTKHPRPMTRLMSQLSSRGLFFLDSRTTAETVAMDIAQQMGVPAVRRDVFLDHHRNPDAIHAAFEQALSLARRRGHAVLIGHPYPMTLDYLEYRLAELPADIRLVRAGELAHRLSPNPLRVSRINGTVSSTLSTGLMQSLNSDSSRQAAPGPQPHPGYLHISPAR